MQFSADEFNPVNKNDSDAPASPPIEDNRKELNPVKADINEGKLNLYDDPIALFMNNQVYRLVIVLCMIQSNNVIVFFRHRIGRRIMRGWIFQLWFLLLISTGLGSFMWRQGNSIDAPLTLYAVLMGVLAIYHHNIGKELTEIKDPNLMLHTMARGDSYLMALMNRMPEITFPMWHFYFKRFRPVIIFPLEEPALQRILEPLLTGIAGILFSFSGSALGGWLLLSALCLVFAESDYYNRAINKSLDIFDSKIEAQVLRTISAAFEAKAPVRTKVNGIATASPQMLQLIKQKKLLAQNG